MGLFSNIFGFFKKLWQKPPKPIKADGPTVTSVYLLKADGKTYRVTKYSDGTTKKEPYNEDDPTGVGGFLDDIRH